MSEQTITVTGMSCQHCVNAVTEEVTEIPGVTGVEVNLETGAVTVTSEAPVADSALAAAIDEAGYSIKG
ncbi:MULTISPECIES: heavy-metal-associated domain-containing protein [Sciscionella]|uniref:heavy-metal-associated domain-containing protein n=1 Tax=Sciscionella TaxID=596495 RepID=UPI00036EF413|nr:MULTISPECIES: copper ion binding protein [Sciscionella]